VKVLVKKAGSHRAKKVVMRGKRGSILPDLAKGNCEETKIMPVKRRGGVRGQGERWEIGGSLADDRTFRNT